MRHRSRGQAIRSGHMVGTESAATATSGAEHETQPGNVHTARPAHNSTGHGACGDSTLTGLQAGTTRVRPRSRELPRLSASTLGSLAGLGCRLAALACGAIGLAGRAAARGRRTAALADPGTAVARGTAGLARRAAGLARGTAGLARRAAGLARRAAGLARRMTALAAAR